MASDMGKSVISAIQTIVDKAVGSVIADCTYTVTIDKLTNAEKNEYRVIWDGGYAKAYVQNDAVYESGDTVLMKVPQNNPSEMKIIEGLVDTTVETITTEEDLFSSDEDDYAILGKNLIVPTLTGEQIGVRSQWVKDQKYVWVSDDYAFGYASDDDDIKIEVSYEDDDFIDTGALENNIQNADAFMIKSNIQTQLKYTLQEGVSGQYGIIIEMVFKDTSSTTGEKTAVYSLTSRDIASNPFKLQNGKTCYKIFELDTKNFIRINSVVIYSQDFVSETVEGAEEDILFRNLEIDLLKKRVSANGDYSLVVTTPDGSCIPNYTNDITKSSIYSMVASLYYKKKKITENIKYYWGKENLSIKRGDSSYLAALGVGWEYISNADSNTLNVNGSMTTCYENNFKVAAVYQPDDTSVTLTYEIPFYNNNNKMDVQISSSRGTTFQFDVGETTLTCKVYDDDGSETTNSYRYIWSKSDSSGITVFNKTLTELEEEEQAAYDEIKTNTDTGLDDSGKNATTILSEYTQLKNDIKYIEYYNDNPYSNKITIKAAGLDNLSATNIKCTVQQQSSSWENVGSASVTLTNEKSNASKAGRVILDNASQVFQYNTIGISPASESQQDPQEILNLYAHFYDISENEIEPALWSSIRWIVPTENTLIEAPLNNFYISEEESYYLAEGNEYPLAIAEQFNLNYTNNQITCEIVYKDETYRGTTDLYFTKVGEAGTNGTATTLKIVENKDTADGDTRDFSNKHLALVWDSLSNRWFWNCRPRGENYTAYEALSAKLYTYNEQVYGFTPSWTPAGMSSTYSKEMQIMNDPSGEKDGCFIQMGGKDTKENVRIASAKVSLDNKTYYNSYPIYTVEYSGDYNYNAFPIDIKYPYTLQYITYDSNGTNPHYNTSQGGVFLEFGDNTSSFYVDWYAKGGPETDEGCNPAFTLARTNGVTVGTTSVLHTQGDEEITEVKANIDYIESCAAAILDDDNRKLTQSYVTRIKQTFINTLSLGMRTRVSKAEELLDAFEEALLDFSELDKDYANKISVVYREMMTTIKQQVSGASEDSEASLSVYNQVLNIFLKYQEIERNLYVTDYTHDSYVGNITDFWNDLIAELIECYNNADKTTFDTAKFNEALSLYTDAKREEILKIDESNGNAQAREDNRDFFLEFKANFESISPETQELSSSYAQALISYYETGEISLAQTGIYVIPSDSYNGVYCNNRVEAKVYSGDSLIAVVTIPIHMSLNVYELASVNGWDGTHIEINEDDDYILTPQIGAGVKNTETNTFTGVVLGSLSNKTETGYTNEKVGLMGFSDGQQSIFLDAKTGAATFGLASDGADSNNLYTEGRIKLVPGGVSEISQWKIGRDSIYNVVDGYVDKPYEALTSEKITYIGTDNNVITKNNRSVAAPKGAEKSIPHDKQGIMLSANPSYIAVKGRPLTVGAGDSYDVNTEDGTPILVDGDSLEVEIDPNARSLFTIYRHGRTTDGYNFREAQVGIDNRGRFYSNSLKDNGTALGISEVAAFGSTEEDAVYKGLQIEAGVSNESTYPTTKLFTEIVETDDEYKTTPLYISGAYNGAENEYTRPLKLYGNTLGLYAYDGDSNNVKEKTNDHYILLDLKSDDNNTNASRIQIHNSENNYIDLLNRNIDIAVKERESTSYTAGEIKLSIGTDNMLDIKEQGGLSLIGCQTGMTIEQKESGNLDITNSGSSGIFITSKKTGNIELSIPSAETDESGNSGNIIFKAGKNVNTSSGGYAILNNIGNSSSGAFMLGVATMNNIIQWDGSEKNFTIGTADNAYYGSGGSASGGVVSFSVPICHVSPQHRLNISAEPVSAASSDHTHTLTFKLDSVNTSLDTLSITFHCSGQKKLSDDSGTGGTSTLDATFTIRGDNFSEFSSNLNSKIQEFGNSSWVIDTLTIEDISIHKDVKTSTPVA